MAYGAPLDAAEVIEVEVLSLCERFGWTREYVLAMDAEEYARMMVRLDALDSARRVIRKRAQK